MMQCMECDVGLLRARVARISLAGDLAYEINVLATEHATLRRTLLEAGAGLGLREIGFNAMFTLRLEKSVGIWNLEYTQGRSAAMTGLDRWIDWDKGDFIGRAAARALPPPQRRLVTLQVEATDADCSGFEPLWLGDRLVGMTTSGGWGHRLGVSLALAMVDSAQAHAGTQLEVQIVGDRRMATVIPDSPYDPSGHKMRA
jgi:dimethylglycine dehydrogenase